MALRASTLAANAAASIVAPNVSSWVPGLWAFSPAMPAWTLRSFPNPKIHPEACGLTTSKGLICDPDRLLANATRLAIQDRLHRLEEAQDYVLVVAVMRRLEVSEFPWMGWHRAGKAAVDSFARETLALWGIGDGVRGPGVMLAVVRDPDYVAIFTEQEAARRGLDYELCRGIADWGVLPYVDNGYLDRGIVSGVEEIAVALRHPPEPMRPWPMSDWLFTLCCLITCLAAVICICGCCREGQDDSESRAPAPSLVQSMERRRSGHHPQPARALDREEL